MRHPPYHLRTNKAIDRFLIIDIINRLRSLTRLSEYTYYGFGGPFLEDFRLININCPEIKLVSIEQDYQTLKRQKFHQHTKRLKLVHQSFSEFLSEFPVTGKTIFWIDYTSLDYSHFQETMSLINKVEDMSIVKITVKAQIKDRQEKKNSFEKQFREILPSDFKSADFRDERFVLLIQKMFRIAIQKAMPAHLERIFQLLHSSYYKDTTMMFSLTGIVCKNEMLGQIHDAFRDWKFLNLNWKHPHKIDVPELSIKERLFLEKYLPNTDSSGETLSKALKYLIDFDEISSKERLRQYGEFYNYYPFFGKILV